MASKLDNRAWVLRQVDRLPLATPKHLELVANGDRLAPSRSSIYAICRELSSGSSVARPLLAEVEEPQGATGYVLTRAGRAELAGPSVRLRPPDGVDDDQWWGEWAVSISDEVRAHTRLTTDLAVVLHGYGEVVTEFEEGRRRPRERFQPDWEASESVTRRPDLMFRVGVDLWAVEIERSAKGSDGRGSDRYRDLAVKAAEGRFLLGGPMQAVSGVWYLVNDRPSLGGSDRSRVADRVVRGMFEAADVTGADLFCVVDPLSLDDLAELSFAVRQRRLAKLVDAVSAMLLWRVVPVERGYVVPSVHELRPRSITSRSVVAIGELVGVDVEERGAVLRVDGQSVVLRSVPDGLAVPVGVGDRVTVFGRLVERGVIDVSAIRAAGVDWEPTSQARSAETVRRRRHEKDAEFLDPGDDF